jgi:hypothetical protein
LNNNLIFKLNFKEMRKFFSVLMAMTIALSSAFFLTSCKGDDDDDNNNNDVVKETTFELFEREGENDDEEMVVMEKIITITDFGKGIGNYTMKADMTYVLNGIVVVNEGQTLTIEPGTIIKGKSGQGENASALMVARGGTIQANGTAAKPIIFTAASEKTFYNHDKSEITYGTNIPVETQGLWGGVIVLGKATTNNLAEKRIEGIPATESRGLYGHETDGKMGDDNDNSGTMKYISIQHGGTDIGAGNEINGLTLGGVGMNTTIEYVEVVANVDDGIEFFGGAPNIKYAVTAYCGDDSYDYDEGYHGKGQFWLTLNTVGDKCGEHDGGPSSNEEGEPYAIPMFYNLTYISDGTFFNIRDNAGGHWYNSIFANGKEIRIEYRNDKHNSYDMLKEGNLTFTDCIASDVKKDNTDFMDVLLEKGDALPATAIQDALDHWNNNNAFESLGLTFANPIPATGANSGTAPTDSWFTNVAYQGAFEPGGSNWAEGWTLTFRK